MTTLLNIDANAKTVKGQKQGFMTAVLYLAPFKAAGINVCPMAELAGCVAACLNTAGRGGIAKGRATFETAGGYVLPDNAIQRARIRRTRFYADDRAGFMRQLHKEISAFIRKAERKGLTPVVRLNGTSDIRWEKIEFTLDAADDAGYRNSIFDFFPDVQFYDYTKIPNRFRDCAAIDNYHLSLSFSAASPRYERMVADAQLQYRAPVIMVLRDKAAKQRFLDRMNASGVTVVDGDEHDLRFLDPDGAIVALYAKGAARHDTTGFVVDV